MDNENGMQMLRNCNVKGRMYQVILILSFLGKHK